MKLRISKSAYNDLENIISHYHSQGVPDIGLQFVKAIIEHIELLSKHPDIGRIVPEFELVHIREIIHKPFRVVYQRNADSIDVIRVWRSERVLVLP